MSTSLAPPVIDLSTLNEVPETMDLTTFDMKRVFFGKKQDKTAKNGNNQYIRVNLYVRSKDGLSYSKPYIVFKNVRMYLNRQTEFGNRQKIKDGYSFGIQFDTGNGLSTEHKMQINKITEFVTTCKEHVYLYHEYYNLDIESTSELRKMNPLTYDKKDKTKAPRLYVKGYHNRDNDLSTIMSNLQGCSVDYKKYIDKQSFGNIGIVLENLFLTGTHKLCQAKAQQVQLKLTDTGPQTLLGVVSQPEMKTSASLMSSGPLTDNAMTVNM